MMPFVFSLLCLATIPVFTFSVDSTLRIQTLSDRDLKISQLSQQTLEICKKIETLNNKLELLKAECKMNIGNPSMIALIELDGQSVFLEQEILRSLLSAVRSDSQDLSVTTHHGLRGLPSVCAIPGKVYWQNSTIQEISSDSGGSRTTNYNNNCKWEFYDSKVVQI